MACEYCTKGVILGYTFTHTICPYCRQPSWPGVHWVTKQEEDTDHEG